MSASNRDTLIARAKFEALLLCKNADLSQSTTGLIIRYSTLQNSVSD